jgi:hypothetical protein
MDMTSTTTSIACHCQVIQRSPDRWDTTPCSGVRSDAGTCASNQARELQGLMPARQGTDAILSATEKDSE